jgi:uncharacterized membrane protein YgaE (UPF0421/DUF939 family)
LVISLNAIRIAVQITLVSFISYLLGFYLTGLFHGESAGIGGLWAAISSIVVLQASRHDTWSSALLRVLGTTIGAVISTAYLIVLPFTPFGMAVSIFVTVLLCHAVRVPDHARLAAITVAVVMVTASLHPTLNPILNAALRLGESFVGTLIAVLTVLIWIGSKEPSNAA